MSKKENISCGYVSPMITEERKLNVATMDVFSRLMADRIIFLGTDIDAESANTVVAQLLFLDSTAKDNEPIHMYINSPGGSVFDGLAIYDTMKIIKCPVITTCVGSCCSMGAVLLAAGEKGKRRIMKHSRVMIHQPSGGCRGTSDDVEIEANQLKICKDTLYTLLSDDIGKPKEEIIKDSQRDRWFSAEEALEYGIVDKIIE